MSSTTVRVSDTIRNKIREISENKGISIQSVIEKAIDYYEKQLFLEELNNAYAKNNSTQSDDLWDSVLMDGLNEEEWDESGNLLKKKLKNV